MSDLFRDVIEDPIRVLSMADNKNQSLYVQTSSYHMRSRAIELKVQSLPSRK